MLRICLFFYVFFQKGFTFALSPIFFSLFLVPNVAPQHLPIFNRIIICLVSTLFVGKEGTVDNGPLDASEESSRSLRGGGGGGIEVDG